MIEVKKDNSDDVEPYLIGNINLEGGEGEKGEICDECMSLGYDAIVVSATLVYDKGVK